MSATTRASAKPAPPAWLRRLLLRASSLIESKWPLCAPDPHYVEFLFKRDGEGDDVLFRAVPHFYPSVVKVYEARTGVSVCQSVEGNPFEIDPAVWDLPGDDE